MCMHDLQTNWQTVNVCENMTKDHPILAVKWKRVSIIAYRKSAKQISRCNLPIFLFRGIIISGVTHTSGNIRCTQPLHSERSDRQNNPHDMIRATYSLHRRTRMCVGSRMVSLNIYCNFDNKNLTYVLAPFQIFPFLRRGSGKSVRFEKLTYIHTAMPTGYYFRNKQM